MRLPVASRRLHVVAPLALALVTFAVFAPALSNGFVWDDAANIVTNPHYRGLGWAELRWMLTTHLMGPWIPLTWITLGLDFVVFGMKPAERDPCERDPGAHEVGGQHPPELGPAKPAVVRVGDDVRRIVPHEAVRKGGSEDGEGHQSQREGSHDVEAAARHREPHRRSATPGAIVSGRSSRRRRAASGPRRREAISTRAWRPCRSRSSRRARRRFGPGRKARRC